MQCATDARSPNRGRPLHSRGAATSACVALLLAALVVALPAQGDGGGRRRPIASGNTTPKFLPTGSLQIPESLAGGALALRAASGAIAADAAGRVFVGACASDFSHRIVVFDSKGKYVRDFRVGNCGVGEGVRIAAGPDGNIYATRAGPNNQIGVYTPDGAQVRLIGGVGRLETATARDIDIDSHGNIYVTIRHDTSDGGPDNDEIVRLSASGAVTARWQPLPLCNGHGCARLQGVAPADDGTLWVTTDVAKLGIQHVDANGKLLPDAPRLDVILREIGNHVRDIDYAAGKLYLVGSHPRGNCSTSSAVST